MARRIIPYSHHGFRPYVEALGQLALAWNELHFNLSLLYCSLMGARVGIPVDQHFAVWHALKMDRAQRDILRAAATSSGLQRAPNAQLAFSTTSNGSAVEPMLLKMPEIMRCTHHYGELQMRTTLLSR